MQLQDVLADMVSTAREAGALTLDHFARFRELEIGVKGPADFVSDADRELELLIRERLFARYPDWSFTGEEFPPVDKDDQEYRWLVDPIDGTTNFVNGMHYTVSIALRRGSETVAGALYNPPADEMFTVIKGEGAFLNGRRLRVSHLQCSHNRTHPTSPRPSTRSSQNSPRYVRQAATAATPGPRGRTRHLDPDPGRRPPGPRPVLPTSRGPATSARPSHSPTARPPGGCRTHTPGRTGRCSATSPSAGRSYGTRAGQKIAFVPLDARLQLPASDYSYLLQQWDQALGCESAFARVGVTLFDVLGLEAIDRQPGADEPADGRGRPPVPPGPARARPPADEGEVMVAQADGKGVVMRRPADEPKIHGHRTKGQKANQKRMAAVGAIYSVGRVVRTPADVVASLFRDPATDRPAQRPSPPGGQARVGQPDVRAGRDRGPGDRPGVRLAGGRVGRRNPGQPAGGGVPDGRAGGVVGGPPGVPAGDERGGGAGPAARHPAAVGGGPPVPPGGECGCRRVRPGPAGAGAPGEVSSVVRGLRQMGTKRRLGGAKRKRLATICGYLAKNAPRMRYDEYLAKGYPIASGVIEGACRHYVKDRLERAGMHWTRDGAQAMLDVRSEFLNGDWEAFQQFRIERETKRLYPHRPILDQVTWALAV